MSRLRDLLRDLEGNGLLTRAPTTEEWEGMVAELRSTAEEVQSAEEFAATSVGDIARLRHAVGRSYTEINDALSLMTVAATTFHDASRADDAEKVTAARQQFSDWLGTSWFAQPPNAGMDPLGPRSDAEPDGREELDRIGAPLRALHQRLRALAWILGELIDDVAAASTARQELIRAGRVQRGLVPTDPTQIPGLDVHSWFEPASHCAGDWWSAHALTERDGLLVVGDVTGHGAASAIVTGAIKGACDVARMGMRGALRPPQLMRMLNRILREATRDDFIMTAVVLRLAAGGGIGAITNAGHRAPLLVRNGQVTALQAVRDPPLGSTESHGYSEMEFEVSRGDLLVIFTDGVPETESPTGLVYGEKVIRQIAQEAAHWGPQAVRDKIRDSVLDHRGGRAAADDVCLLVAAVT